MIKQKKLLYFILTMFVLSISCYILTNFVTDKTIFITLAVASTLLGALAQTSPVILQKNGLLAKKVFPLYYFVLFCWYVCSLFIWGVHNFTNYSSTYNIDKTPYNKTIITFGITTFILTIIATIYLYKLDKRYKKLEVGC